VFVADLAGQAHLDCGLLSSGNPQAIADAGVIATREDLA
jgi:hypothetical protein